MKKEVINQVLTAFQDMKEKETFIHFIPNPTSLALCSDMIAAIGGQIITAVSTEESAYITRSSDSIVLNLAQPGEEKNKVIEQSLQAAMTHNIPIVFDPERVDASPYRKKFAGHIMSIPWNGIVKGNMYEIQSILYGQLQDNHSQSRPLFIDFSQIQNLNRHLLCGEKPIYKEDTQKAAAETNGKNVPAIRSEGTLITTGGLPAISGQLVNASHLTNYHFDYDRVLAITGKYDYIVSRKKYAILTHRTEHFYPLAGAGCGAGCLCGIYAAYTDSFSASVAGLSTISLAGDLAFHHANGYGDYKAGILNSLSLITKEMLEEYLENTLSIHE